MRACFTEDAADYQTIRQARLWEREREFAQKFARTHGSSYRTEQMAEETQ